MSTAIKHHPAATANVNKIQPKKDFEFTGGAGSFFVTAVLAWLVTVFTLGLGYPWALCMIERWKAENTCVEGRECVFRGTGLGLFGKWIKFWVLTVVTFGIYSFWIVPDLCAWKAKHTHFVK